MTMSLTNVLPTNTFRVTRGKREIVRMGRGYQAVYTPTDSHWRKATCEEMNCTHYLNGWSVKLEFTPQQRPVHLLRAQAADRQMRDSGKKMSEVWDGSDCIYQFEAGQTCFRTHKLPIERDPVFLHVVGQGQARRMDYDEFFDTSNEHFYRAHKRGKEG